MLIAVNRPIAGGVISTVFHTVFNTQKMAGSHPHAVRSPPIIPPSSPLQTWCTATGRASMKVWCHSSSTSRFQS